MTTSSWGGLSRGGPSRPEPHLSTSCGLGPLAEAQPFSMASQTGRLVGVIWKAETPACTAGSRPVYVTQDSKGRELARQGLLCPGSPS